MNLSTALTSFADLPAAVEAKATFLPKVSPTLKSFASSVPAGTPDLPIPAVTIPALPDLPALPTQARLQRNFPVPNVFIGPNDRLVSAQQRDMGNKIVLQPGSAPVGLQTKYITEPNPAGALTNTVIERRGV